MRDTWHGGGLALIAAHQGLNLRKARCGDWSSRDAADTAALAAGRLLFERDLRLAMRRWDQVADPLVFFLIVTTLFPLALSPELSRLRDVAPGVLWVAALLSSLLAADSLLKSDAQDGTLEQYVLSGQPLTWLLLAKTAAHWMS